MSKVKVHIMMLSSPSPVFVSTSTFVWLKESIEKFRRKLEVFPIDIGSSVLQVYLISSFL